MLYGRGEYNVNKRLALRDASCDIYEFRGQPRPIGAILAKFLGIGFESDSVRTYLVKFLVLACTDRPNEMFSKYIWVGLMALQMIISLRDEKKWICVGNILLVKLLFFWRAKTNLPKFYNRLGGGPREAGAEHF